MAGLMWTINGKILPAALDWENQRESMGPSISTGHKDPSCQISSDFAKFMRIHNWAGSPTRHPRRLGMGGTARGAAVAPGAWLSSRWSCSLWSTCTWNDLPLHTCLHLRWRPCCLNFLEQDLKQSASLLLLIQKYQSSYKRFTRQIYSQQNNNQKDEIHEDTHVHENGTVSKS